MNIEIGPQPGPQTQFVSTKADIAIYGGAAGGGKSYGLLLDPLRHYKNKDFGGTIFRRTKPQIKNEGGLWDESVKLYPKLGSIPREHVLEWRFPTGMGMSFASIEYDKDVLDWQGSQLPWIGFDELTHFTETQFFYMLSRNRSICGAEPCVRATCNPDPDSFVRQFIDWWIGEDGFAIPEKSGVLRYFIRINDSMIWANSKEEIFAQYGDGKEIQPTSVTFIPSKLEDNKILMDKNPRYLANLLALNRVDRLRLKDGNWNIRASAGMMFQQAWFPIIDAIPAGWLQGVRFWDRAATKPRDTNKDPDWTRGLLMLKYPNNTFIVTDLRSMRDTPGRIEDLIKNTASYDSQQIRIMSQQDPGSAGVAEAENFVRMLAGFDVRTMLTSKDKITRAKPVSAQCEAGNIKIMRAPWNKDFFNELENFPEGTHDDIVDVLSGAFNELNNGFSICDVL